MLRTGISFERAMEVVEHYHTPNAKGKTPKDNMNSGFTTYVNCLNVVKYVAGCTSSVPTKASKAKRLLEDIGVWEKVTEVVVAEGEGCAEN